MVTAYCCKEHQTADWHKNHRSDCKRAQSLRKGSTLYYHLQLLVLTADLGHQRVTSLCLGHMMKPSFDGL